MYINRVPRRRLNLKKDTGNNKGRGGKEYMENAESARMGYEQPTKCNVTLHEGIPHNACYIRYTRYI
jgi:hypothetical protein